MASATKKLKPASELSPPGINPEQAKYESIYRYRGQSWPGYGHTNHGQNAYGYIKGARSLLDVGCGWNEFVKNCRMRGIPAHGVDFACPGADSVGDVCAGLPFDSKSFEWVTCFDVMEHLTVEQVNFALAEMSRLSSKYIFAIASFPHVHEGMTLHQTVQPLRWWKERIAPFGTVREEGTSFGSGERTPYLIGEWFTPQERKWGDRPIGGKKIAVLCPGPSLSKTFGSGPGYPDPDSYDVLIGVNRAVCFRECDVWVMLDWDCFQLAQQSGIKGKPLLVIGREGWVHLTTNTHPLVLNGFSTRPLEDYVLADAPEYWNSLSALSALGVAYLLGGRELDVYGMDMVGSQDFDGTHYPEEKSNKRAPNRWPREQAQVQQLVEYMARRDCKVTRYIVDKDDAS